MGIKIESSGQTVTAYLDGEIDHHSAREMRETIDRELESGNVKLLILDFRDVTFMDSSGIGLVMGRYLSLIHIFLKRLRASRASGTRVLLLFAIFSTPLRYLRLQNYCVFYS